MIKYADDAERRYCEIVDVIDRVDHKLYTDSQREYFISELRALVAIGQPYAMNLLAIFLGNIDMNFHRQEIISLYTAAFEADPSGVAAGNFAIQYKQWNEPELHALWRQRARAIIFRNARRDAKLIAKRLAKA